MFWDLSLTTTFLDAVKMRMMNIDELFHDLESTKEFSNDLFWVAVSCANLQIQPDLC